MSRMINPVILVGLSEWTPSEVNNSCCSQQKIDYKSNFIFRYLNIPDNGQSALHREKFPHPLTSFLADL